MPDFFPANIQTIVIAILVLAVGAVAAYYLARALKGKIEIELPKKGYNSGEEVAGRITLKTKRSLEINRLYVALVGYQILESMDRDGDRETSKKEIYRNEVNLLEDETVASGSSQVHEFTIIAPGNQGEPSGRDDGVAGQVAAAVGSVANVIGALGLAGDNNRRLEWRLEARADVPGVDLARSQALRINLR